MFNVPAVFRGATSLIVPSWHGPRTERCRIYKRRLQTVYSHVAFPGASLPTSTMLLPIQLVSFSLKQAWANVSTETLMWRIQSCSNSKFNARRREKETTAGGKAKEPSSPEPQKTWSEFATELRVATSSPEELNRSKTVPHAHGYNPILCIPYEYLYCISFQRCLKCRLLHLTRICLQTHTLPILNLADHLQGNSGGPETWITACEKPPPYVPYV
ncbi:hypothetical protein B0I72DRAFT_137789 [Yarrowia lipolytica]|uniref:Uncharacterized protein n=1 Tax=Yarrowia lipolytica TaxID=4952 RepID=A0A371CA55_YARLL|nr:hypothetical protein B0I71DRAFT_129637 [Yarrowia lipolytica]RDW32593.1 hypothetical protein B0I72DRAFT_137789 [Yarrowia lipolytica]RDW41774.1 hypothetical protein B0I73DRAFT_128279 [Yarrowia lipolytica]RDW48148.1 hypothetical protein B0I74DRAFT_134044 [Yarrowia lipolytica]RDW54939.1 hypothetical protein B0I75DRAFT_133823 [Yarrowia lipolytica]